MLTDLERIAPCLPGFELQEVVGDEYRGAVKVKVGPMTAQYKGVASFRERDEANHRAVVRAEGRDTRGQGNAAATVTATLVPEGGGTRVTLHTDLTITGKVAQFGRGVLADVSSKLLGQFVQALEADVLKGAATAAPSASDCAGGPRRSSRERAGRPARHRGLVRDQARRPARRRCSPSRSGFCTGARRHRDRTDQAPHRRHRARRARGAIRRGRGPALPRGPRGSRRAVFQCLGLSDAEQLAFTDSLGTRVKLRATRRMSMRSLSIPRATTSPSTCTEPSSGTSTASRSTCRRRRRRC